MHQRVLPKMYLSILGKISKADLLTILLLFFTFDGGFLDSNTCKILVLFLFIFLNLQYRSPIESLLNLFYSKTVIYTRF